MPHVFHYNIPINNNEKLGSDGYNKRKFYIEIHYLRIVVCFEEPIGLVKMVFVNVFQGLSCLIPLVFVFNHNGR